jgi:hypothetical protein
MCYLEFTKKCSRHLDHPHVHGDPPQSCNTFMSQSPKASVSNVKGVPQETIRNIKASLHKTPKHVDAILTEEQLKTQKKA